MLTARMFAVVGRLAAPSAMAAAMIVLARAFEPSQSDFSSAALRARMPAVREEHYAVNTRIRPLLLFWIDRDSAGGARITWRQGSGGRRGFDLLVGTDPARAPRQINQWGFLVEELNGDTAEILGIMSKSGEPTIEEANTKIDRRGEAGILRASRTTVTRSRAVTATMTLETPGHLTFRDLDAVLAFVPASLAAARTVDLPPGTQHGFLVAMDGLMKSTAGPCRTLTGGQPRGLAAVPFLYQHTIYELSLKSCRHEPKFRTETETLTDLVDGTFQITNRVSKQETHFRVVYGSAGDLMGVPVRGVFRPRWWMEIELVLKRSAAAPPADY